MLWWYPWFPAKVYQAASQPDPILMSNCSCYLKSNTRLRLGESVYHQLFYSRRGRQRQWIAICYDYMCYEADDCFATILTIIFATILTYMLGTIMNM